EGRDPDSLAALRRRCAETMRTALPPSVRARLADLEAVTEALLASLRFRSYDDVAPGLTALRDRGTRLVVVSNWDVSLHLVLDDGVPVYSSDGQLVGTVDHVVAAPAQDIFHGIVMRISSGEGPSAGQRFVAADQIASLHERGVDLAIDDATVAVLPEPHGAA